MQMKPPFILLLMPLVIHCFFKRRYKTIFFLSIFPVISTLTILFLNHHFYGSPFRSPIPFTPGNFFTGSTGLLFSFKHGLIFISPVILISFYLWPRFFKEHPLESKMIFGGFILYFLLMASFHKWWGGFCYGPRLVLPVIPWIMVSLSKLDFNDLKIPGIKRILFVSCCIISILINTIAVFYHPYVWGGHPFVRLYAYINFY